MNHTNAKLTLEKINRLFKSMEMDAEHISRIERDLMLSYIQQLYELFLDANAAPSKSTKSYDAPPAAPKKEIKPEPTPREQPSYTPPPRPESRPMDPPEEVSSPYSPPPPPPREETPPSPPPRQEETPREPPRQQAPQPVYTPSSNRGDDDEVDTLFEQEQARELADKLGSAPLSDLTRAFSINDRLYFINELFGRDQQNFVDTLRRLNELRSFDEAKQYLAQEVARKYDWTKKEKKATAKAFIKTVRRKFNR